MNTNQRPKSPLLPDCDVCEGTVYGAPEYSFVDLVEAVRKIDDKEECSE